VPLAVDPETHAAELLFELRETRAALLDAQPGARLLAIWDLDGTLLRGDCSEGLVEHGRTFYPGLVQLAIEEGLAADYPAEGGVLAWREDYALLKRQFGPWLAYPFLAQIFAGAKEQELVALAERHFARMLTRFFFASSRQLFDALAEAGVEQHIISASPEFFVRGAAATLGLPPEQLHGIRVRLADGRLTRDVLAPVTFADGKREQLRTIIATPPPAFAGRAAFVLAGFGNDFATDGAFLQHVAHQRLPGGQPLAVIVNAGIPPAEFRRQFRGVRQARVVGDP
jgi:phosphoserine phosphatase